MMMMMMVMVVYRRPFRQRRQFDRGGDVGPMSRMSEQKAPRLESSQLQQVKQ
jgi:hypothetical protein